jgi:hypothetical protein
MSAQTWALSRGRCMKNNHLIDRQPQFDSGYGAVIRCDLLKPKIKAL